MFRGAELNECALIHVRLREEEIKRSEENAQQTSTANVGIRLSRTINDDVASPHSRIWNPWNLREDHGHLHLQLENQQQLGKFLTDTQAGQVSYLACRWIFKTVLFPFKLPEK